MEWQQIEYFYTVAKSQHMTHAAEELSISQPALSRSISRLEDELGVPLFQRQGRNIILNRYGKLFLNRAERILREFEEGKQEIQDLLDPEFGEISLGFLHTLGINIIPDMVRTFHQHYPKTKIKLHQNDSASLLHDVVLGEIDLCLVNPVDEKLNVHWENLWNEELFVMVPKNHRLAKYDTITFEEIKDEPFISLKEGIALRSITNKLCDEAGFVPNMTFEGEEITTIAGLVAAGLGVTLIPDSREIDSIPLAKLRVRWPNCERQIGLAWGENHYMSPAVKAFRSFIFEHYQR
ncbi:LysR family transcriptional regulator [Terrilactibacillus sp. BCM23-1]|uniref:LysR family transcriptional regulator n=1 Tax=Terrilactibacillus tamarindi TaxID=2599694 RepID=A0A6N8CLW2_9BACI|nr:LysR family transcriptional regulator [Terrilactibacillus tamarindi]MTT30578.1 LysR family transcriptional regulator [Terrilactibacillus tamarindi]